MVFDSKSLTTKLRAVSWVGGKTDIFVPMYSADGLGFTVAGYISKMKTGNSVYEKWLMFFLTFKVNKMQQKISGIGEKVKMGVYRQS